WSPFTRPSAFPKTRPGDMAALTELSASQLAAALRRHETTAVAVAETCLAAIREHDDRVHAFATITAEDALAAARAADAALAGGRGGPLAGVPIAVKDL